MRILTDEEERTVVDSLTEIGVFLTMMTSMDVLVETRPQLIKAADSHRDLLELVVQIIEEKK